MDERARAGVIRALPALALGALVLSCGGGGGASGPLPTPPADAPLGVAWDPADGSATFRVWAPRAASASVLFFATWDAAAPTVAHPMTRDASGTGAPDPSGWNGVWEVTVPGVAAGQLYQLAIGGVAVLDPYAPSMGLVKSSAGAVGKGAVLDVEGLAPADPATGSDAAWVPFTAPPGYAQREDAVIYEVHVRDFTIADATLPAADRGTYLGFTSRLGHVRALGATHVQLLPVMAYLFGDEDLRTTVEAQLGAGATRDRNYNWGYDPQSWFAPDGMYASDPADPAARVRELKGLVNEAHRQGLGVILDAVYNHTATTAILDPLARGYFYRGSNRSGVGNDVATERKMVRKLIVDSVRHWVTHYRVDGLRFDLMGLVDSVTMEEAHAAAQAAADAVQPGKQILFVGEGWRLGGVPQRDDQGNPIVAATQDWMASTDDAAVFSDSFRDLAKGGGLSETDPANRGFLTGAAVDGTALLRNLRGDATNFAADDPGDAVQYLTAHDGLTLHDKIAKVRRLNPDDPAQAERIMEVARLGLVLQATAQGIGFVHGGCEMGRSKRVQAGGLPESTATGTLAPGAFVYNSYDSSDAVNGYRWDAWLADGSPGRRTYEYARGLFALRRESDAFRLGARALATTRVAALDATQAGAFAWRVDDAAGARRYAIFVNAGDAPVTLATGGEDFTTAEVLVDRDEAGPTPVATPSGFTRTATALTLEPRTAVVLRR